MIYTLGQTVRVTAAVKDVAGVAADPSAVSVKLKDPAGSTTTNAMSRSATGAYYWDFIPTLAGQHLVRIETTGTIVTATEGGFLVANSSF